MQNFKNLNVWHLAHAFTLNIYRKTSDFPKEELYSLTRQIRRASYSIPANIAEGCGKNTNLDFANFLQIALGSANEVEYFLLLAHDLDYLNREDYLFLEDQVNAIKAKLINFISRVRG